jgi:hypothetical protein
MDHWKCGRKEEFGAKLLEGKEFPACPEMKAERLDGTL